MSIAFEVQNIRDVEFLVQDDPDDPPHLFVDSDSVSSSITGLSSVLGSHVDTVPSPHMFLPYAAPRTASDLLFEDLLGDDDVAFQRQQAPPNRNATSSLDDDFNSSTPHMFLPYATKGYQSLLSRIERQENAQHGCGHLLSHDIVQFEAQCLDTFRTDHGMTPAQSTVAANAMGKAVEQTATMHTKRKDRLAFFESAFKKAMQDSPDVHNNACSIDGVHEEAQEELNFLRNCVRELVGKLGESNPMPVPAAQQHSLVDVVAAQNGHSESNPAMDVANSNQASNRGYLHHILQANAVPERIEIPAQTSGSNTSTISDGHNYPDGSDVVSLLTPFDEPFVRCRLPSSDNIDPVEDNHRRQEAIQPFIPISGFSVSDLDSSKDVDLPAATRYIETVQLIMKCRPGRPSRKLLMNESEPMPVQAVRLRLQMYIMGVAFMGLYNGSLLRGVPHGPGVFRFDNRDLYVGNFEHGMMHGEGTLFCRKKLCMENSKLAVLRGRFECNEYKGGAPRDDLTSAGAA